MPAYSAISRILTLLRVLADNNSDRDIESLAVLFGTSEKTIRRDIAELRSHGIVIQETSETNNRKIYTIDKSSLPPLKFNFDEALTLFLGASSLPAFHATSFEQGKQTVDEVSSALLLGAQAVNAENVPFVGAVDQNLLLHFWPLSILTFVPMSIDADGDSDFSGFALAIPEVSDLNGFLFDFTRTLENLNQGLNAKQIAVGYRPRRAVIDLPAESAMVEVVPIIRTTRLDRI